MDKILDSVKDKQTQGFYGFASFRIDVKKRRLLFDGELVPLTPKEFDVLLLLVENAGRIVEKDELLEKVWKNAFVEEGTVARNSSWLRKKLAAHAENDEKIIETLSKRGYRFLPEVTSIGKNDLVIEEQVVQQIQIEEVIELVSSRTDQNGIVRSEILETAQPDLVFNENQKALPPVAKEKRRFSLLWIVPALLILVVFGVAAYRGNFSRIEPKMLLASKIAPFSGLPGRENFPAFSPDGKQMVFSWDGGNENGNFDVYVKFIGDGDPVRLTDNLSGEINPVFSPDGKSIAFVRVFPDHNEIILISALGGAERKVYDKASYASLSFSPDGKRIAHAELGLAGEKAGIVSINLETGEKTLLTAPEAPAVDHTPRFSPDGKSLAFIRYFSSFRREIFVIPALGGEPRQITSDDVRIYGLAWSADNEQILFTSYRSGNQLNLWQIALSGGEPKLIPTGGRNLQSVAMSPNGRTIAFVEESEDENIWHIEPNGAARPLICSSRADHSPQFSPDGSQIVFASDRTGNYEIWIADAEGKKQRQLTDSTGSAGSPRFSPGGNFIVYDAQIAERSDIYIVSASGGSPRRLTETGKNNSLPAWSADGNWIFFVSNRTGSDQIWKMPATGGDAVQITRNGAFEMFAAPDGKEIIYSKGAGKAGLWRIGTNGGEEKTIQELAEVGGSRSWFVAEKGVYYTAYSAEAPFQIKFFDFVTKQTKNVAEVEKSPLAYYSNLCVSADGKKILYARQDLSASTIMLAELN